MMAGPGAVFDGAAQWAFFKLIFEFLDGEVETFRDNLIGGTLAWVSGVMLTLLTMWILFQGYQIMTGRSKESLMGLVVSSLRSVLIVTAASTLAFSTANIYTLLTDDMPREIMQVVTGDDEDPADTIDDSLDAMQLAMIGIDSLAAMSNQGLKEDRDRAIMLTGVGVAGPAIIGGAMLLLYKIALAMFVGLGPLFILSLLFEQTKSLFSRWLYYGIGTMFSLAVLSFMVGVAMKMVLAVATAFAAQYAIALSVGAAPEGVNSMALQQGGMGIILTVLLVSTPPMAAMFFQGTLGNFMHFSAFGNPGYANRPGPQGQPPGSYAPPQPQSTQSSLAGSERGAASAPTINPMGAPIAGSRGAQPDVIKGGIEPHRGS